MEKFGALDNSEITIAIPGDRWCPKKAKQEGYKGSKTFSCVIWTKGMLEVSYMMSYHHGRRPSRLKPALVLFHFIRKNSPFLFVSRPTGNISSLGATTYRRKH